MKHFTFRWLMWFVALLGMHISVAVAVPPPNILWLTSEDNGPHLGCYGDEYAVTPNIDSLAKRGALYTTCWSNAPVCAPARTTIISGLYPPSTGSEHMRSMTRLPAAFRMFPQHLREAGYYCTNNSKEDYNLEKPGKVWDASSRKAHWKNRQPGQPFFAVFNSTTSHESKIRMRPHTLVHNPDKVRIPAYHPDRPEVRRDWAQYYDKITEMDVEIGHWLHELKAAGLAEDTIIFYYGDHGSGMPRSKRSPCDSGLRVPLVVYFPEKYRDLASSDYLPGGKIDRLVSFVDLPATVLSLAGIEPPKHYQGHAFLGPHADPPQPYVYGFRGRMDERYDLVRSVGDGRFVYIRNYMPHKIYGQYLAYMFQTPTTRVWKDLYDAGKLSPPQTYFWERKPPEELYDLQSDPDEVHNLAALPGHQKVLTSMRTALREHIVRTRDVGFLPEDEIHRRAEGSTPYDVGHDEQHYPLDAILETSEMASSLDPKHTSALVSRLQGNSNDCAVRYWAALGLLMRGTEGVAAGHEALVLALEDKGPSVRIVAAQCLAQFGSKSESLRSLSVLFELADMNQHGIYVAMQALNAIDEIDDKSGASKDRLAKLSKLDKKFDRRIQGNITKLVEKMLSDLE